MATSPQLSTLKVKDNYNQESLNSVLAKIHTGNSILFLGAGFSLGSTNNSGKEPPIAKKLSRSICSLGGFDRDEDLAYSADYYLKYHDPVKLIELLNNCFSIKTVEKYHERIASVDWRRVYTTNYDNCYELASGKVSRVISPVTLEDNPDDYFRNRDICVHINGAIQTLDVGKLENSFKLSESSYTNSDAFSDSSWAYRFKKDIDICSQIVFVGYSLYDMEIKRLLASNESLKQKTYFITREDVSQKSHHRLSAFGEVFPIGVKKFGTLLDDFRPISVPHEVDFLSSLKRESLTFDKKFGDTEIRDFLLRGKCISDYVASSIALKSAPYAIEREQVREALSILNSKNVVILHGALANGKSVIALQIASHLIFEGKLVYTVKDKEAKYEQDIEKISNLGQTVYLIIDDFENCTDLIQYYCKFLGDRGKLILTERPHRYRRGLTELGVFNIESYNINTDYLHSNEVIQLEHVIDNTGLWGDYGGKTLDKRIFYIEQECESQLSIVLLEILKSPNVVAKFKEAFTSILKHADTKKVVHAICLIQHIYPSQCTKSFIATISDSNHVYTTEFEERIKESNVFELKGNLLVTRSSIFSTFVLNTLYQSSYSIDQLIKIADKINRNKATQTREENEMYRSLMTFGTLSAILPEKGKPDSYKEFYEKLKNEIPSVKNNPHYWLQFAMAVMSESLNDAEIILKTAYSKAENISDYDTTYIDNQFARLNLKKAINEENQNESIGFFLKAHNILKKEESDIYKFRQAGLYNIYFEKKYSNLSKGNKVKFEHALKQILKQYEEFIAHEYPTGDYPPYHVGKIEEFKEVERLIIESR